MTEDRVQKILARAGYGSRRANEELISAGRVRINGVVAVLGSKADPQYDTITVDNQPIGKEQAPVYIAINKPHGVLSEVSPEEPRETVRDLVPVPGHMFIVGRLDLESEGLVLLTNDGELANKLTHPRYGHEKEYRVLVGARPDEKQLEAWRHGIVLEDGHRTAPAKVQIDSPSGRGAWLRVTLNEGRKRQIREMGKLTGLPVLRIIRVRISALLLGDLKPGQWRNLRPDEVRALKTARAAREASPARRQTRAAIQKPAHKHEPHSGQQRIPSERRGGSPLRKRDEGSGGQREKPRGGPRSQGKETPRTPRPGPRRTNRNRA